MVTTSGAHNVILSAPHDTVPADKDGPFQAAQTERVRRQNMNSSMIIHPLKSFGSNNATGSLVLIVENDTLNREERLKFTLAQNKSACVFMQQDSNNNLVLDYYYPHARSPLCLHGTLAAGYVYFAKNPDTSKVMAITDMHKQKMLIEKHIDEIFLSVVPEIIPNKKIENKLIARLLKILTYHML